MPNFLKNTACQGHRPPHLVAQRHFPRPALIAKLLRERHVARFIVAPGGYGKTSLALEYADTVFRLEHVFWMDGKSPCFLRDLDDVLIARTLLREDPHPFLLVIEDVPPLDPERVELLSKEMDQVLARGCEVLATCTPTCDAFDRHRDRVKLTAVDLLLDDTEIDLTRSPAQREEEPASRFPASQRAAGLVWAPQEERQSFLTGILDEELPADIVLPLFIMLSLQKGALSDLAAFAQRNEEVERLLAEQYPFLGIDLQHGVFNAIACSMPDIAAACATERELIASRSLFGNQDAFAIHIADALVAQYQFKRACDTVRLLASREARATWLAERGEDLFNAACLAPASEVYESLAGTRPSSSARLEAAEAARRCILGDRAAACIAARRAAGDAAASVTIRIVGALIWALCAEGADLGRANRLVSKLTEPSALLDSEPDSSRSSDDSWPAAACVHTALETSCPSGAETWLEYYDRGVRGSGLTIAAIEVLRSAVQTLQPSKVEEPDYSTPPPALDRIAALARKRAARTQRDTVSLLDAIGGLTFERACERGIVSIPAFDTRTALELRKVEMDLFAQRRTWERFAHIQAERKQVFDATHPDAFRTKRRALNLSAFSTAEPTLTVNLFGGLEVRIGNERVDPALFRRQKVKTLLALLVLERGREFSRDKLASTLWPDSDPQPARKNFYGIWSSLRRALTTPAGTCPYLIRQQNGVRLDASLLDTDVVRLEEVCRTLLFEHPGYGGWAHLFEQINDRFSADLLPSESTNDIIVGRRADLRDKLVDALVTASGRLVLAGEAQEGLWFARAALQRDRSREDSYLALMRAQLAAGQRTAALETYFDCRRYLTNELGIDPSMDIIRLYRSIIETEEDFE